MRASSAKPTSACICSTPGAKRPLYGDRERAALAWVEAITLVAQGHVPDDVFDAVHQHFSEKEIVDLTAAAIAINSWNRIAIAFRVPPQVESKKAAA